jgi:hypothetical protein
VCNGNRSLYSITLCLAFVFTSCGAHAQLSVPGSSPDLDTKLASYFNDFSSRWTFKQRIEEFAAKNQGHTPTELVIEEHNVEAFVDHGVHPPQGVSPLVVSALANSDVVVQGIPYISRSLPVQDETFLFTQYAVRVQRVFSDPSGRVRPGDTIIVSRQGGVLVVQGIPVRAVETAFDQFTLNVPYIFALKRLKDTETYLAIASRTFVLANGVVTSASKLDAKTLPAKSSEQFVNDLQEVLKSRR